MPSQPDRPLVPTLVPLGDGALLIRFGDTLSEEANAQAIIAAGLLEDVIPGVLEVVPGLVSVLLRYAAGTDFKALCGEVQLRLGAPARSGAGRHEPVAIGVTFDGEDVEEVATSLGLTVGAFIAQHNSAPLRVLATGFAPGFVYCGFHGEAMLVARRHAVRPMVPAGTVLFAARQTAIAATPIRTGWHVIGRTTFQNFDPLSYPPTRLRPGDPIAFEVAK